MFKELLKLPSIRRVKSLIVPPRPRAGFMCHILSSNPFILHTKEHIEFGLIGRHLGDRVACFFVSFTHSCEDRHRVKAMRTMVHAHGMRFPAHEFIFLGNSTREVIALRKAGLRATLCGSNCFIDEQMFQIDPVETPRFDAIYDGQLLPVKRHYLASDIRSLALITYIQRNHNRRFGEEVRRQLSHAHWFNDPFDPVRSRILTEREVAECYRQCRVGLCLSPIEGQMYASVQYLLCGLPVVTTQSRGGRDEFFDSEYVVYVGDSPKAVKEGVGEAIKRQVPAEYIRARTLKKMEEHRSTYVELLKSVYGSLGIMYDVHALWRNKFINKMVRFHSREDLISAIHAHGHS